MEQNLVVNEIDSVGLILLLTHSYLKSYDAVNNKNAFL